tara:strand:+ start:1251 stop:1829 length:579 start_codon:yes stop_codon:yes gene_type:complete
MKKILYIASKNRGKISEYKKLLSRVNCELLLQPEWINVVEDGQDFRENAIKKACEVSLKTENFAISDDSGLCIDALNGRPGLYSSRFANNDFDRIKRVLLELEGEENRKAHFVASVCLTSPQGEIILDIEQKCYGNILYEGRGSNGFGYDPIFEEEVTKLTFAEMNNNLKDLYSHRGKAISRAIPKLLEIFK